MKVQISLCCVSMATVAELFQTVAFLVCEIFDKISHIFMLQEG